MRRADRSPAHTAESCVAVRQSHQQRERTHTTGHSVRAGAALRALLDPKPAAGTQVSALNGSTAQLLRVDMPPRRDQLAPDPRTSTGQPAHQPITPDRDARSQGGEYLTTAQGLRMPETDHSLKAGERGPTLLEDFHLRDKITHFDHERIPERVVHARGAGAHGTFESYGAAASITTAGFLAPGATTPAFARFSTVLGSRGSADTVRDTRGFAVKFYTDEGTFDLVGDNMPVSSSRTASSFPTSSTRPSPSLIVRYRRPSRRTIRSGTSSRCTPKLPITCSGT